MTLKTLTRVVPDFERILLRKEAVSLLVRRLPVLWGLYARRQDLNQLWRDARTGRYTVSTEVAEAALKTGLLVLVLGGLPPEVPLPSSTTRERLAQASADLLSALHEELDRYQDWRASRTASNDAAGVPEGA